MRISDWSSNVCSSDLRDFENGRPRKAKDRFPAINHDAVPVGGYEASLFIHIIQRCDADDEAVGASQQLAEIIEHIRVLPFQSAVRLMASFDIGPGGHGRPRTRGAGGQRESAGVVRGGALAPTRSG